MCDESRDESFSPRMLRRCLSSVRVAVISGEITVVLARGTFFKSSLCFAHMIWVERRKGKKSFQTEGLKYDSCVDSKQTNGQLSMEHGACGPRGQARSVSIPIPRLSAARGLLITHFKRDGHSFFFVNYT